MVALVQEFDGSELELELEKSFVPQDSGGPWQRILAGLHPKQRAFVLDPAARKCAEKGRRAGGSHAIAAWLLEEWTRWPGAMSLFIALTKESAKNILWPTLELFNAKYELGAEFNGLDLEMTLPNGYRILLRGAKDKSQVEKLRGFAQGVRRIAADEVGSYSGHLDGLLRHMIQSVLSPQLMDQFHLGGGQLALCGSPGIDPMGFYFERCTGKNHIGRAVPQWSTHHWTAFDNPHVDARGYLVEELVEGQHVLDDTPPGDLVERMWELKDAPLSDPEWAPLLAILSAAFRREYLADWVKDSDALVYQWSEGNLLPFGYQLDKTVAWRVVIAADVGWNDGNGFAVAAKSLRSAEIILLHAYYLPELDDAQIAGELKRLKEELRLAGFPTGEIYVDCGGEGSRLVANFENHGVVVQAAEKPRKRPRIEYVRALLKALTLKLRPEHCAAVLTEWSALPWSPDHQSHREGYVDDVSDAVLMAVNPLSQRFLPAPKPRPRPGQDEYEMLVEAREKALAVRAGRRVVRRRLER